MTNPISKPEVLTDAKGKVVTMARNKIFDLIGISIVLVMFFVGLGALKIIDFTLESLINFIELTYTVLSLPL